jgi:hypothetical protein
MPTYEIEDKQAWSGERGKRELGTRIDVRIPKILDFY